MGETPHKTRASSVAVLSTGLDVGTSLVTSLGFGCRNRIEDGFPVGGAVASTEREDIYHIERPVTDAVIDAWNIDISPRGEGLPPGQGTVSRGAAVYAMNCAGCHGPTGTEGPRTKLVGGQGTLRTNHPVKTVGSYWPYATTLYDYIYRAMPLTAPQTLTPDEIYSVIAWLLNKNGIIYENTVIDAKTLPLIRMPNQAGFVPDSRPDLPLP